MKIKCANCAEVVTLREAVGSKAKCACGNTVSAPAQIPTAQKGVVNCTNCWKRYAVVGRPEGTRFRCKACNNIISVRSASNPSASSTSKRVGRVNETVSKELLTIKGECEAAKKESEKLKTQLENVRAELIEKSRLLDERDAELLRVREESDSIAKRVEKQSTELAEVEQKAIEADQFSQDLVDNMANFKEKNVELEKSLAESREELEALKTKSAAEIAELNNQLLELPSREELDKFNADRVTLDEQVKNGAEKLATLKMAIAALREPLVVALGKFDEFGAETGEIKLPDYTEEFEKTQSEVETLRSELKSKEQANCKLQEKMQNLQTEKEQIELHLEAETTKCSRLELEKRLKETETDGSIDEEATADDTGGFVSGLIGRIKKRVTKPKDELPPSAADEFNPAEEIFGVELDTDEMDAVEVEASLEESRAAAKGDTETLSPVPDDIAIDEIEDATEIDDLDLIEDIEDAAEIEEVDEIEDAAELDDIEELDMNLEEAEDVLAPNPDLNPDLHVNVQSDAPTEITPAITETPKVEEPIVAKNTPKKKVTPKKKGADVSKDAIQKAAAKARQKRRKKRR